MKLAVFQMSADIDQATNPDRIIEAMRKAKGAGADLLVAPELALTGYGIGSALRELAEPVSGPMVARMAKASQKIGIKLVAGFPERDGNDLFISALIADGKSAIPTAIYRKAYLYGDYEKRIFTASGPSTTLVRICGLKAGFLICYDVEFPENVRRLAKAGADIVIVPTALPRCAAGNHIANRVVPVRAFENQLHIVYANYADSDATFLYQGNSSIVAPDSTFLAKARKNGDALLIADIITGNYAQSRAKNPYLTDLENGS